MTDEELLSQIMKSTESFGPKCSKYSGAVTVEWLRQAFRKHGIHVSHRDVFIKGLPIEFDLILPRDGATPNLGLLYEPEDVRAVIEVKAKGVFGKDGLDRINQTFKIVQDSHPHVHCAYVTLTERQSYRWAATNENLNAPAFTLFWHTGAKNVRYQATGEWEKVIRFAREVAAC